MGACQPFKESYDRDLSTGIMWDESNHQQIEQGQEDDHEIEMKIRKEESVADRNKRVYQLEKDEEEEISYEGILDCKDYALQIEDVESLPETYDTGAEIRTDCEVKPASAYYNKVENSLCHEKPLKTHESSYPKIC